MKRSTDRILTTHAGSMPRPQDLVEMLATKRDGGGVDEALFAKRVREAVDEGVRKQADAGIDIISDGEMGKSSFVHYVRDRIAGFEGVEPAATSPQRTHVRGVPRATTNGATAAAPAPTPSASGPFVSDPSPGRTSMR